MRKNEKSFLNKQTVLFPVFCTNLTMKYCIFFHRLLKICYKNIMKFLITKQHVIFGKAPQNFSNTKLSHTFFSRAQTDSNTAKHFSRSFFACNAIANQNFRMHIILEIIENISKDSPYSSRGNVLYDTTPSAILLLTNEK